MIQITEKNKHLCSGCHACISACPQKCIEMLEDDEGFKYPSINLANCIDCGICEKMCQAVNPIISDTISKAYGCYNKDNQVRIKSSSGGIFTLIATKILEQGGVVFGAAFDENWNVQHICVNKVEDLYLLRGSKYVQSVIGDTYIKTKKYLEEKRKVLFTGTPCQIDGLYHFLKKEYSNLYTQDIICHGVPSPKVWSIYKEVVLEENKKPTNIEFRNKDNGWENYNMFIDCENQKYIKNHKDDIFMKAFLNNLCLRPSCYSCNSKSKKRNSDITLADFWYVKKHVPELFDDKGVSLILVNSKKGEEIFSNIEKNIVYKKVNFDEVINDSFSAYKSAPFNKHRNLFMKKVNISNFEAIVNTYSKQSLKLKIKILFAKLLNKIGIKI